MRFYFLFIVASFLIGSIIALLLDNINQNIIGVAFILSIGLIHGANDIAIIKKFKRKLSKNFNFKKSVSIYTGVVFLTLGLFVILPQLALWLFILISAYHFGEQHWTDTLKGINNKLKIVFYTIYGLSVLFLLLFLNADFAKEIIQQITPYAYFDQYLVEITKISFILLLAGFAGFILYSKEFANRIPLELLQLFSLFLIFEWGNLIFGFAFYFVAWHSLFSIKDQLKFLYGNLSKRNLVQYVKQSAAYWAVSLVGLAILVYLLNDKDYFYSLMFAFIAAVTFPHVIVISQMMEKLDE